LKEKMTKRNRRKLRAAAPIGRPPTYKPSLFPKQAKKLCELGAIDADLADAFAVSTRTIWRWMVQHKDFCQAVKVGKKAADDRVERALYQRAVGYSFNTVKVMQNAGTPVYAEYV
jgi:hypothetical protein